jgi:CheY-like chemotaxis protein
MKILLVGDTKRPEFRRARAILDSLGRLTAVGDSAAAVDWLSRGRVADVIVVALAYPGQFSQAQIQHLRRLAPVARMVALAGSWCEGEMRSGKPWPGVLRIYWHQWPVRARRELRRLCTGRGSTWSLPVTATEEERILLDVIADVVDDRQSGHIAGKAVQGRGLAALWTRSWAMEDWLCELFRRHGYATVWLRPPRAGRVRGARIAVFDGSQCSEAELDQLRRMVAAVAPAPVIALLDFPRAEDVEQAQAHGAAAVLSKPLMASDLLWHIV